jgi:hypothetical protein
MTIANGLRVDVEAALDEESRAVVRLIVRLDSLVLWSVEIRPHQASRVSKLLERAAYDSTIMAEEKR